MNYKKSKLESQEKYFKWTDEDCTLIIEALSLLIRKLAGVDGERKRRGYVALHAASLISLKRIRREIKREKGNLNHKNIAFELIELYLKNNGIKVPKT